MNDFIYDIECFPNVFSLTARMDHHYWQFEISDRKNQIEELISFLLCLRNNNDRMVGFNNIGYDYPVLHFVINNRPIPAQIYDKSCSIIQSDDRFGHIIWDDQRYVQQIDLFKIHHFDNIAKSTSLKALEFTMRSDTIEDLPFKPGTFLDDRQKDILLKYNKKDVDETYKFYIHSQKEIKFREELSAKYGKNFINHNDTKIGKDYFLMKLEEYNPGCTRINGSPRQSPRSSIDINQIILPYINLTHPALVALKDWFSGRIIRQTKGVFNDISLSSLGSLTPYCKLKKTGKSAKNLNCIIDNFQLDFGTGGLHGSVDSQTIHTDESGLIIDVDVTAFYPNIAIQNTIYPEHLGPTFCYIYQDVLTERAKHKKGTVENKMMKLAANGTFGDTNSIFSSFYDPQYTMSITINGQLLLCMLIDKILPVPGLKIVQVNTDGITVKCPHQHVDQFRSICKTWEGITKLQLEENCYKTMFIRDVNNYVAVNLDDGKIKKKGAYDDYSDGYQWSKNYSALVVKKAVLAALLEGADTKQFIYDHSDKMDFLLRAKVPRSSFLIHGNRVLQNTSRYYASTDGESLVKVMPPTAKKPTVWRKIGINTGYLTTECNEWSGNLKNPDYNFYLTEAKKLIDPLR